MIQRLQPIFLAVCLAASAWADSAPDFNREIRPILSENCFFCHGPDAAQRKAGLRLDMRENAVAERKGRRAIDEANPAKSQLLRRIASTDPEEIMPPPDSHKHLKPEQVTLLRRWVEAGAPYQKHWAFLPPKRLAVPGEADGALHAADRFIHAALRRAGLPPSQEAPRELLLRRVSFDLTGLPPSPAELAFFLADESPNAYERQVDRLLASPAYGERMALAWMDAARYGDTSVMHADGTREMWPWRDWVIQAYNANLPFDQFTREQLAGDLFPNATPEQQLASGFNRNHATSDEGGAIDEELRVEYVVDRVKTTANVWLALTLECAQCHDHKYDPISQREYYQFFAYFNNTTDPGIQSRSGNQEPVVRLFSEPEKQRQAALRGEIVALEKERKEGQPEAVAVEQWLASLRGGTSSLDNEITGWHKLGPFKASDAKKAFERDFGPEKTASAIKLDAKFKDQVWAAAEAAWNQDGKVHMVSIPDGGALYLHRVIRSPYTMPATISLGSDDSVKAWLNGKQIVANDIFRLAAPGQEKASVVLQPGENVFLMKVVNLNGGAGFAFQLEVAALPEDLKPLVAKKWAELAEGERQKFTAHYRQHNWPEGLALDQKVLTLRQEEKAIHDRAQTAMVMRDNSTMRATFVLNRGQYDQPRKDQPVEVGLPAALPLPPPSAPRNRLGLAEWLTQPEHPLTARVAVNRLWAMLFGEGIVKTQGDFGSQGSWPSHPELLDWLAVDFVESGWDVKRALRQMVGTATYRQHSQLRPDLREADPENRLLARGPRFRLMGEWIRDQALAASGLLVHQMGGSGFKPYQPEGLWGEVSLDAGLQYVQDKGAPLYRRGLYIYWKRSVPMPNMLLFDAPSREKCTIQRQRTNTPLQALVTLNDPQFVEAARIMAERLIKESARAASRIDLAYRLAVGRAASVEEIATLEEALAEALADFQRAPDQAVKLLAVGEFPREASLDAAEVAAWTIIAQMVLNLDESLTRG